MILEGLLTLSIRRSLCGTALLSVVVGGLAQVDDVGASTAMETD